MSRMVYKSADHKKNLVDSFFTITRNNYKRNWPYCPLRIVSFSWPMLSFTIALNQSARENSHSDCKTCNCLNCDYKCNGHIFISIF